jgi:K+-transporting ATPase c subunit
MTGPAFVGANFDRDRFFFVRQVAIENRSHQDSSASSSPRHGWERFVSATFRQVVTKNRTRQETIPVRQSALPHSSSSFSPISFK